MPTKTVKGGKATAEFETRTITLRGITYTMRELDVDEYEECLKSAEDERGFAEFGRLLKMMTIRAVSPSPAARERPLPYPIYRTLEQVVNVMHFSDLNEDAPEASDDEDATEPETVPNDSGSPA